VQSARTDASATRFLGVRLSLEELERLDQFGRQVGAANRSESVRALLRASERTAPGRDEVPIGLREEIEILVEDGWASSWDAALTLVLTMGLRELPKLYAQELPSLGQRARDRAARRRVRRTADRTGEGLLDR
jgi:hypothetical protein